MVATTKLRRIAAMLAQLDQTSAEYIAAKDEFDSARVGYEVAREKFASVRRIAKDALSKHEWQFWLLEHANVQYSGLKIGEAIIQALESYAWTAASRFHGKEQTVPIFDPSMTLEHLQRALEYGGFEFRTTTPLREVNAGLMNLAEVTKEENGYKHKDADTILETAKDTQF